MSWAWAVTAAAATDADAGDAVDADRVHDKASSIAAASAADTRAR